MRPIQWRLAPVAQWIEQLTVREAEILDLLAIGLEPADVAERLDIGTSTVSTHLEHIMGKLGAHSRAQMIALAYQQGIVSPA